MMSSDISCACYTGCGAEGGVAVPEATLGERLRLARRRARLSQARVAERLGVTQQAVSQWETGLQPPNLENVIAAAKLYNVSIDWLLGHSVDQVGLDAAPTFDVEAFEQWARGRLEDTFREIRAEYTKRSMGKSGRHVETDSIGTTTPDVERFAAQGGLQRDPQAIRPGSHEDRHLRAAAERARKRVLDEEGHDSGRS